MNNGALHFNALLTTRDFETGIRRLENQIRGISNTTQQETSKIDGYFKNLSTGIGAYFSANMLQGFVQQLIQVRGEFQKTEIAFGTMLKSKEKAKELMEQMVDLAAKTPFGLQEVSEGAKRLLAFQVPANEVVETLRRMGDVAAGLGVPMGQLIHIYGQVKAQGKLMTNDLYQFMNAGIPILDELGKVMGKSSSEIKKMVGEGKIGFTEIQQVIQNLTNEGGLFFNLMEQQSASLPGRIANLGDAFDQMLNKIGKNSEGVLYKGIDSLTYLVEHYDDLVEVLGVAISAYGVYKVALMAQIALERLSAEAKLQMALAQGSVTTAQAYGAAATTTLQRAQASLNATIMANPLGLLIGLLATATYAVYKYSSGVDTATELQDSLNKKINEGKDGVAEKTAKLDSLIERIKSENTTNEEKKGLLSQINQLTDGKLGKIDLEMVKTGQLQSKIKDYIGTLYEQAEAMAYVSELQELYKKKMQNERRQEDVKKNGVSMGEAWDDFWDKDTYKGSKASDWLTNSNEDWANRRLANENKAIDEQIQFLKKKTQEKADIIAKAEKDLEVTASNVTNNTSENKKGKGSTKELAEVYSKDSIKDLEQRISLWNNALERADSDGNVKVRAKDRYGKEYETKTIIPLKEALEKRNELEKELEEKRSALQKKSFDEELAEIQRQVNLRDKYLQAGYSKESMDNLFQKVKDKTYLGYLNDTRDSLKKLLDTGKGNQETAQQLDRVNKAIDEFTAKKSYIEGIQETIENLSTQFSGQELIDKLKKIKNLNANETEQESQEKANLINKTIEQEEQKMKQAYQRFIQEHKSFEERRLEITKQYDALRKQALTEAGGDTDSPIYQKVILEIDKAESKDQTDLFFEEMQKSKEWIKVFEDMNMVATNKLEEFKRILKQKLTEAKTIEEKIKIGEFIKKIDDTLRSRNPFKVLKDGIKALGDESLNALEKAQKLQNGISAAQSALGDMKGIVSDVRGAFDDLGISTDNALGDFLDDVEQTIEGLNQMAEGVSSFVQGMASGNPVQMVAGAVKAVAGVIKTVSGWFNDDKKRERNIKRWAEALESVKEQYRALEHQMKKTLGEGVYKEQAGIIANLRKQQEHLQRMANEEAGKKKSDGGKIKEWQNQIKEINRQIDDIMDNMINDIAKTDAKTLADQIGDALVDAFSRGEDAALAYEKTMDEVMKNAIKSALKQKLLAEPMKAIVDDMVAKMGFGGGNNALKQEIEESEKQIEQLRNKARQENGLGAIKTAYQVYNLKNKIDKLKQDYEDSKKINLNGTFDGLTASEREKIKEKGKDAMNRYMEALKQYEDLFGSADANADSLKGAIKGMSEETAGVLAGQFNAIRINTGEILKKQGFGLEVAQSCLAELHKIEHNTFQLHQMRKDLADLNSKVKGDKDFRANGF